MDERIELEPVVVPRWTWLLVALGVLAVYVITMENGALLGDYAERVHEFFHDARHFTGFPCH